MFNDLSGTEGVLSWRPLIRRKSITSLSNTMTLPDLGEQFRHIKIIGWQYTAGTPPNYVLAGFFRANNLSSSGDYMFDRTVFKGGSVASVDTDVNTYIRFWELPANVNGRIFYEINIVQPRAHDNSRLYPIFRCEAVVHMTTPDTATYITGGYIKTTDFISLISIGSNATPGTAVSSACEVYVPANPPAGLL